MSQFTDGQSAHRAGAFDIRSFIAALIGLYGIVLVLVGLFGTSDADLQKADGSNVNLWAGIGMVVVAVVFQVWAKLRPVVVPEEMETRDSGDSD
jgi:hypothetical protein